MNSMHLSPMHRAKLFSALVSLDAEQGGWDKVFQLLNQGQLAARKAQQPEIAEQFEEGQKVVLEGLKNTGQFLAWELSILEVGLASASIGESFVRLRDHYLLQQRLVNDLNKQLRWPLTIVVAILVGLLVYLGLTQTISLVDCSVRLMGMAVMIVLFYSVFKNITLRYREDRLPLTVVKFLSVIPGIKQLMLAEQQYHYFKNLQQCSGHGLSLAQSLKISAKKIPNNYFTPIFDAVYQAVNQGGKLSSALASSQALSGIVLQPLTKNEASGLDAQAHLAESAYHHYIDQLWFWVRLLPQMLYALLPLLAYGVLWAAS